MQVSYIASRESARQLCASLLQHHAVALDTEGVRLGRFGRVCVLQLATTCSKMAYVCDALRAGVVEELKPLLECRATVKVMHDCREDSAALYGQHGVLLNGVYDTQIAHRLCRPREATMSFSALVEQYVGDKEPEYCLQIKRTMGEGGMWKERPLSRDAVRYAVRGANHLLKLRDVLNKELSEEVVLSRSAHHVAYAKLNNEIEQPRNAAKIGTHLYGLAVARKDKAIYFKLNVGRTGVVCTPSALSRFNDIDIGDTVQCVVSGVSHDGSYIYLDRYDHDWDYYEFTKRPKPPGTCDAGREVRHETSVLDDEGVDPLLVRVDDESDDEM